MTPEQLLALRAAAATGAAVIGGGIGLLSGGSHSTRCGMVSLAAGALLAVTVLHIVPEAIEMTGLAPGAAAIVLGTLAFFLVGKYVYYTCPACAATGSDDPSGFLRIGVLLIITMTLHSMMDGLAIAAGYEHHGSERLGPLILLAVSYHKVPEGLALVSVCRLAGWPGWKAMGATVLVELTTALGAVLGAYALKGASPLMLGLTLGFVAGSFLYTVGFATLKEMYEHERTSILSWALLGSLSIIVINLALPGGGH
jgi:ZIP family zinc transporter